VSETFCTITQLKTNMQPKVNFGT